MLWGPFLPFPRHSRRTSAQLSMPLLIPSKHQAASMAQAVASSLEKGQLPFLACSFHKPRVKRFRGRHYYKYQTTYLLLPTQHLRTLTLAPRISSVPLTDGSSLTHARLRSCPHSCLLQHLAITHLLPLAGPRSHTLIDNPSHCLSILLHVYCCAPLPQPPSFQRVHPHTHTLHSTSYRPLGRGQTQEASDQGEEKDSYAKAH